VQDSPTVPRWLVAAMVIAVAALFTHQFWLTGTMLVTAALMGAQLQRSRNRP
jgi:hypothetical protein